MGVQVIKKLRTGGALLAALLLALMTSLAFSPASPAATSDGSQVQIDSISIDYENEEGVIEDWRWQTVEVKWSIPGEAEAPVSLTIELPEGFYGNPETFPLYGPDDQIAGQCTVTRTQVTCAIDDAFIAANPRGVAGDFTFQARTELDNREDVPNVDFGNIAGEVVVTPSRNWCVDDCEFGGVGRGKSGIYNTADDTIVWTVRLPAGEDGIAPGQQITMTDLLDEDSYELIVDGTYPRVREAGQVAYDRWGNEVVTGWSDYPATEVAWSDDNLTATFQSREGRGSTWNNYDEIAPPAQGAQRGTNGTFYQVQWKVKALTGGELQANGNRIFRNAAEWTIAGVKGQTDGSSTRNYRGGNVVGTNYGKFQITKELSGDTTLSPAFTVNYTAYEGDDVIDSGSFTLKSGETYTSMEYFKGTRIVLEEVLPATWTNVTWAAPRFVDADGNPANTLEFTAENNNLGEVTEIRLLNEATLRKSSFAAKKNVVNEDGVPLADDMTFALNYSYPADPSKGFSAGSGTLTLPINGDVVSSGDLPVGAVVTLTEPNLPNVPGAQWADPVIEPSTVTIGDSDDPVTVAVTNTISQDVGGFSVTKALTGDGEKLVNADATFTVTYEYDAINGFPGGDGVIELKAGETATVEKLPAGATVTLTELEVDDPTGGTWGEPEFSANSFTIVKDTVVSIDLDNPISWNNGDFSVRKAITGDGADLVSDDALFTVDYSYTLPQDLNIEPATGTGSLTVRNDGQAVVSEPLPYGTEVSLSEADPAAVAGGTWVGHEFDNATFTIGDKKTFEVVLTNEIERDLGSFAVTKAVQGSGADLVGSDVKFTVNYSYPAGQWYEAGAGSVQVTKGGTATVNGIPAGAVVTLEESLPADPENGTWESASFPDGNVVVVEKNEVDEVKLVNKIELGRGGFSIKKHIKGSGSELVKDGTVFVVYYEYDAGVGFEAGEGSVEVSFDGTVATVDDLPAGATVRLSEQTPAGVDGATWAEGKFSTNEVTISKSEVVKVSLTNTIQQQAVLASTGASGLDGMVWGALSLIAAGASAVLIARRRRLS